MNVFFCYFIEIFSFDFIFSIKSLVEFLKQTLEFYDEKDHHNRHFR